MNNFLKISFISLFILALASKMTYAQNINTAEYKRLTYTQMTNIASSSRLSHRIFYTPSRGANAAWFDAVKKGDIELVKKMLEGGTPIEAKDTASLGQTALGWAAFIGYMDIVEYLVANGANLYATDSADVTSAFKSAILGGNIAVIEYLYPLMKDKINLNAQDVGDGETALMVAVDNDRVDAVKFLLSKGANPNIVARQINHSAFSYACRRNNLTMIDILKQAGAINNRTQKSSC